MRSLMQIMVRRALPRHRNGPDNRLECRESFAVVGRDSFPKPKVAVAEIDLDVVADLPRGIDKRLKRRNIEVTDVDPVAGFEARAREFLEKAAKRYPRSTAARRS